MLILNLLFLIMCQAPAAGQTVAGQTVKVGLDDGQELILQDPEYSGFIEGRSGDAVLMYHQSKFHGEMPLRTICRIEFASYRRGKPFAMIVTLRNGQTLRVESERRDFMLLRGKTDFGTVTIKQPDPIYAPVKLSTKKADRTKDLTIQYLEIPTS